MATIQLFEHRHIRYLDPHYCFKLEKAVEEWYILSKLVFFPAPLPMLFYTWALSDRWDGNADELRIGCSPRSGSPSSLSCCRTTPECRTSATMERLCTDESANVVLSFLDRFVTRCSSIRKLAASPRLVVNRLCLKTKDTKLQFLCVSKIRLFEIRT